MRIYLIMSCSNRNVWSLAELAASSKTINSRLSWSRAATTSALRILASKQAFCAFFHFFVRSHRHFMALKRAQKIQEWAQKDESQTDPFCNCSKNSLCEKRDADYHLRFSTDGIIESPIARLGKLAEFRSILIVSRKIFTTLDICVC